MSSRNLADILGLPLELDGDVELVFGGELPRIAPRVRTLEEMRPFLYNQTATGPRELYFMYRNVGFPGDIESYGELGLRFDVTVLVPGLVGGEYVKTAGHYHPAVRAGGPTYPELYQVVSGKAHYLLQKPGVSPGSLEDVVIADAETGDALYVPPGYGHVTINPGSEPLVMVNIVDAGFSSIYDSYRERHGAAYYEVVEHDESYFIDNEHYPDPPEPRLAKPTDLGALGLRPGEPLYRQFAAAPVSFAFLSDPRGDGPGL